MKLVSPPFHSNKGRSTGITTEERDRMVGRTRRENKIRKCHFVAVLRAEREREKAHKRDGEKQEKLSSRKRNGRMNNSAIDTIDRARATIHGGKGGFDVCYSIRYTGFSFCFISLRFAPAARNLLSRFDIALLWKNFFRMSNIIFRHPRVLTQQRCKLKRDILEYSRANFPVHVSVGEAYGQ